MTQFFSVLEFEGNISRFALTCDNKIRFYTDNGTFTFSRTTNQLTFSIDFNFTTISKSKTSYEHYKKWQINFISI